MPDDSPDCMGVSVTRQVCPRSAEENTRARTAPPEPIQTFDLPWRSSDELLAAKAASSGSIRGNLSGARRCQVWPPSDVLKRYHFPSTGSPSTSPLRLFQKPTP